MSCLGGVKWSGHNTTSPEGMENIRITNVSDTIRNASLSNLKLQIIYKIFLTPDDQFCYCDVPRIGG